MTQVVLSQREINGARLLAHGRNDRKVDCGVLTKKQSDETDIDIHFIGIKGELAVAKILNIMPDIGVGLNGDGHGPDMVFCGWSIEVKTRDIVRSPRCRDFALYPGESSLRSDCGILVYTMPDQSSMDVVGVVSRKKFERIKRAVEFGTKGVRYLVPADEMSSISDFIDYLREPMRQP